ncbi:MAG: SGNH/GDSL hydrolase family protein [Chloroflexi bacterium]|nr:SGNH/GDSL hydrolase family protein [Chloroflexota bacterium]
MILSLGLIIKLFVLLTVVLVVVVVVGGVYIAVVAGLEIPGLAGAFRAEADPVSPEVLAQAERVEAKIDESIQDKSAFFLELTDEELRVLLLSKLDPTARVRDVDVNIKPQVVDISGSLNGRVGVPFSGSVGVTLEQGEIDLTVSDVSVGFVPLPGAVKEEIQPLIDEVLDINERLREAGATQIQQLNMVPGKVTIIGVQAGGATVSPLTQEAFTQAFLSAGARPTPVPPGASVVPPGTVGSKAGQEIYLALGDSLAANKGVSQPQEGYVSRFHAYLERETGRSIGLTNLGVSGESSISVRKNQLPQALNELRQRRDDGDPNTKVSFLTLDLGANDLLPHIGSDDCQSDPRGNACQARIDGAIAAFEDNFGAIVAELRASLETDAEFYIMTIYNPFDFGLGIPFEDFGNEILERMNAIIRATAQSAGAEIAEAFPLMNGNAAAWTHMLEADIHPTAEGYQTLAFSFAQAREQ